MIPYTSYEFQIHDGDTDDSVLIQNSDEGVMTLVFIRNSDKLETILSLELAKGLAQGMLDFIKLVEKKD